MESEETVIGAGKEEGGATPPLTRTSEIGGRPDRPQILLAASGIAGPLLYASVVIVLGLLRPGYDHLTQVISELGEMGAPNAVMMNIFGFILPSLLIVTFAFGLGRGIRDGRGSIVGPAFLAIGALGFVGGALFPCSPGCGFDTSASHFQAGAIGFALILAPFALWISLRKDSQWQGYGAYSLVTGVVVILIAGLGFSGLTRPWDGLGQRLWAGLLFLWIVVLAIHLLRLSLQPGVQSTPEG